MKKFAWILTITALVLSLFLLASCAREVRPRPKGFNDGFEFYAFLRIKKDQYQTKGSVVFSKGQGLILELQDTLLQHRILVLSALYPDRLTIRDEINRDIWQFQDPELVRLLSTSWPDWLSGKLKADTLNAPSGEWDEKFAVNLRVLKRFKNGSIRRFILSFGQNELIFDILNYHPLDKIAFLESQADFRKIVLRQRPSLSYLLEVFHGP